MANILDTIVEQKQREVSATCRSARVIAAGDLRDALLERGRSAGISSARCASRDVATWRLIAEVKKASPSAGRDLPGLRSGAHRARIRSGGRKLPVRAHG